MLEESSDLGTLLRPVTLDQWRDHERLAEPLLVRSCERRRRSLQAIPPADVATQMRSGARVRLLRVDAETYHGEVENPEPVTALGPGETLHCDRLCELYPELRGWEQRSEARLGVPRGAVTVKQSLSQPGAGFPWHYDSSDVVVAQVCGHKRWRLGLRGNVRHPLQGASIANTPPRVAEVDGPYRPPTHWREIVLAPGDVLFVPRGIHHRTLAVDRSQSLSIRLRPPMWLDIIEHIEPSLGERLVAQRDWRARAFGAWRHDGGQAQAAACPALQALIDRDLPGLELSAAEALRSWSESFELPDRGVPQRTKVSA